MPTTMVTHTTGTKPPDTAKRDKGAVTCPTRASKLFGCAPAAVADVLDRAADTIHAAGLWQGDQNADGHCVVTAVRFIAGYRLTEAAFQAFTAHLRLTLAERGGHSGACITWNDTPGRTAAEVCGEMRACAAGLRITSDSSGYRTVSTYGATA
jgi:hypothetical protein